MAFNIPAGGSAKTKTPSITIVDNTSGESVDFTVTNNDGKTAVLVYEIDDTTPDLYSIELATSTTSGTITLSGLSDNTSYTIYCFGISADKVKSIIASQGFTTPEILYYELLADTEVTGSAVTSVTFSGLSIGKTDDVVLVASIDGAGANNFQLFVNGNTTTTNYYDQYMYIGGTTVSTTRVNENRGFYCSSGQEASNVAKIKLTNDGYYTYQMENMNKIGTSALELINRNVTSTFTMGSITQLDIIGSSNAIDVSSRFQLFKVVA